MLGFKNIAMLFSYDEMKKAESFKNDSAFLEANTLKSHTFYLEKNKEYESY